MSSTKEDEEKKKQQQLIKMKQLDNNKLNND